MVIFIKVTNYKKNKFISKKLILVIYSIVSLKLIYPQILPYGEPNYFSINPKTIIKKVSFNSQ